MKLRFFLPAVLVVLSQTLAAQSFQQFLTRISSAPETQRQAIADSFMVANPVSPIIEQDTLAHYVYNAQAQKVALAGDVSNWKPDSLFTRVEGCNFWYYTGDYENDARLDYKLVINDASWILDPGNPNTCTGGFGPNSELRMPYSVKPPEVIYYGNIPHGTIKDTVCQSVYLGNSRNVKIYLPAGYPNTMNSYPLVLFHDGLDYINLCNARNILDYLIHHKMMAPVIAVFVPPVNRSEEYSGSKKDVFTNFIVKELLPSIDAKYKTTGVASQRAMIGASDGGNISLYIALKNPGVFGNSGAQSSNVIPFIPQTIANGPKLDLVFYLDIGTYDIPVLVPKVNNLKIILEDKGYQLQFHEWHEGHSWGNWMEHLRYPLTVFFPVTIGTGEIRTSSPYKFGPVVPNPFYRQTRLQFSAPVGTKVALTVFDLSGKKMKTIYNQKTTSPSHTIVYDHDGDGGEFIMTMEAEGKVVDSLKISVL